MKNITIFYDNKQTVETDSMSPSSKKPKEVIESWKIIEPNLKIKEFQPVSIDDLKEIHDSYFVDGIFNLTIENGFNNYDPNIPESLRYTSGSMVAATIHAATYNEWTISPTSGFHHSEYDNAQGFCTFNGLMLAAKKVLDFNLVKNIAVIDLDMHYGNGTDNISKYLKYDQSKLYNYTFGGLGLYDDTFAQAWLDDLPRIMDHLCQYYELIIYQAGADPHIDDSFGGVLSTEQMRKRDEIVFEYAFKYNRSLVWNLAGGYQTPLRKVLDLHDNTFKECLKFSKF